VEKKVIILFCGLLIFTFTGIGWSQRTFTENFESGIASLNWFSAWEDSLGNPLTPMVPTNETGPSDDWIGVVSGDLETLGSLGLALAGEATLADYSMEAQVYVELGGGYYNGIMVRTDTTNAKIVGYQLVANFNTMFGAHRVRFRYFSQIREEIRTLAEINAADLPGGAPTTDGWHKMKIKAVGNQFWLYWDDQEVVGSPFTDPEAALSQGFFGVYVWDAMSGTVPTTKVDDIIIRDESGTSVELQEDALSEHPKQFMLFSTYPNPFSTRDGHLETRISYQALSNEHITITIYDILGREVKTLVSKYHTPGLYTVAWNGKDEHGIKMASGVYTYTLRTDSYMETKKLLLLK